MMNPDVQNNKDDFEFDEKGALKTAKTEKKESLPKRIGKKIVEAIEDAIDKETTTEGKVAHTVGRWAQFAIVGTAKTLFKDTGLLGWAKRRFGNDDKLTEDQLNAHQTQTAFQDWGQSASFDAQPSEDKDKDKEKEKAEEKAQDQDKDQGAEEERKEEAAPEQNPFEHEYFVDDKLVGHQEDQSSPTNRKWGKQRQRKDHNRAMRSKQYENKTAADSPSMTHYMKRFPNVQSQPSQGSTGRPQEGHSK